MSCSADAPRVRRRRWRGRTLAGLATLAVALLATVPAGAAVSQWTTVADDFASPLFGLAKSPENILYVADAGAGPTKIRHDGSTSVVAGLPGNTDVLPLGHGRLLAVTSTIFGPTDALYRVSRDGDVTQIADLAAFEQANDPDEDGVETDAFDLAKGKNGRTYVADAAGNDILVVDRDGDNVDWVATLPEKKVSTAPLKRLVGCPNATGDEADFCSLPSKISADPVATSVAVGPDGALYVTELRGFPATPGTSRVWRIRPGTRHARCGESSACEIVARGFTSIIDLAFGPNDKAYVVELDEKSWYAMETGRGVGGTVNACKPHGDDWDCHVRASHLPMPTGIAFRNGNLLTTLNSLVPGEAQVARLP